MHIVIVGPGAMGSLLAVRLTPHLQEEGFPLFLLDHSEQRARRLDRIGFVLEDRDRELYAHPRVLATPETIPSCDVLLLCVKAGAVDAALAHSSSLITPTTLVIGLQNGMAHLQALRDIGATAVAATSSEGAALKEPGRIVYGGAGITRLGLLAGDMTVPDTLIELIRLFNRAGIRSELVPDIRIFLWEKLFINVGINALTAIYNCRNGELLSNPEAVEMMKKAVQEARLVAEFNAVPLREDPLARTMEVCRMTAHNISSMLQDVRRQRTTEIEAINGYIVREGKAAGIDTPVNRELVRRIREIERRWSSP